MCAFKKTAEQQIVSEVDKISSMKDSLDALSWNRVIEISKALQGNPSEGARKDLARELIAIAQANISLNAKLGISENTLSGKTMASGIEHYLDAPSGNGRGNPAVSGSMHSILASDMRPTSVMPDMREEASEFFENPAALSDSYIPRAAGEVDGEQVAMETMKRALVEDIAKTAKEPSSWGEQAADEYDIDEPVFDSLEGDPTAEEAPILEDWPMPQAADPAEEDAPVDQVSDASEKQGKKEKRKKEKKQKKTKLFGREKEEAAEKAEDAAMAAEAVASEPDGEAAAQGGLETERVAVAEHAPSDAACKPVVPEGQPVTGKSPEGEQGEAPNPPIDAGQPLTDRPATMSLEDLALQASQTQSRPELEGDYLTAAPRSEEDSIPPSHNPVIAAAEMPVVSEFAGYVKPATQVDPKSSRETEEVLKAIKEAEVEREEDIREMKVNAVNERLKSEPFNFGKKQAKSEKKPMTKADLANFKQIYQSSDGRLCIYEDALGHLVAVDASKLV